MLYGDHALEISRLNRIASQAKWRSCTSCYAPPKSWQRVGPFNVSGNQIEETDGHLLAVVTTDSSGNATLSVEYRDLWYLIDVVVTELQPAR